MNPIFHFRQFSVLQSEQVFKIGTDSVLLGAWTHLPASGHLLDIGTGTGVLALMAAQQSPETRITALDIHPEAITIARENIRHSPYHQRIRLIHSHLLEWQPGETFDHVISNPPYFKNALKSPSAVKNQARHQDGLALSDLAAFAFTHSHAEGKLSLVIPADIFASEKKAGGFCHWHPQRICYVSSFSGEKPLRILVTFGKEPGIPIETELVIYEKKGEYSATYKALTAAFYSWFPTRI